MGPCSWPSTSASRRVHKDGLAWPAMRTAGQKTRQNKTGLLMMQKTALKYVTFRPVWELGLLMMQKTALNYVTFRPVWELGLLMMQKTALKYVTFRPAC